MLTARRRCNHAVIDAISTNTTRLTPDATPACRSVQDVSEVVPVLAFIRQHASELVAVGEVGLDFSPHVVGKVHSEEEQRLREVQREVFKQQIQLANELGLPVNVHSRSAGAAGAAVLSTIE